VFELNTERKRRVIRSVTEQSCAVIKSDLRKTAEERLAKEFALIDVIGVTGQNARNLYIDKEVNAVRKNKILQHYLEETFKMPDQRRNFEKAFYYSSSSAISLPSDV
jgi:hypothetical protein